ncbi:MAG: alginate export family protein [Pirellulaceae bacterium]
MSITMKNSATFSLTLILSATFCNISLGQDASPTTASDVQNEHVSTSTTAAQPGCSCQAGQASGTQASPCEACQAATCPKCSKSRKTCCCGHCVDWEKTPGSYRIFPRPGNFPIPPTGCGYYSLADQLQGNQRPKPQPSGYAPFALMAPSFYEANFTYLESVPVQDQNLVERMKRIPLNDCWTFSTGGQYWARYMNEQNSRLTDSDNDYTLMRTRVYGDLLYGDNLRLFGEFIWADSLGEELDPLPIDVNRGDILNMFIEANLFDYEGHSVYARVGRQELLLGSQRLVSTLDWANTRRTFDGVRIFRQGDKVDFDLFYTKFVPAQASEFDTADNRRDFAGAWLTYRPKKGHFADFYYLYADDTNDVVQQGITRAPNESHTFGSRYAGDDDGFLWDFEGALQFGDQGNQDLFAGMASAGLGRKLSGAPMNATAWVCYDYASGGQSDNGETSNTFNQLYPFGHYYLGWADQVARQNIHDVNAHLYFYPQNWMTVWMQYHHFWLDDATDALYNAGGVARRRDATGAAGKNVGDEIDIVMNFHLNRYSDVMVGYSHLIGDDFLKDTAGPDESGLTHVMFQTKW